jgi:hypothetical protein
MLILLRQASVEAVWPLFQAAVASRTAIGTGQEKEAGKNIRLFDVGFIWELGITGVDFEGYASRKKV